MPDNEQENCIIDCRISTPKQYAGGGLDDQQSICVGNANKQRWNVLKIFRNIYSGRAAERADFEEKKRYIKMCQSRGITIRFYLIKSIDRFTRDGAIIYKEMQEQLEQLGVQLVDVAGVIQPKRNTLEHLDMKYDWSMVSPTESAQFAEAQKYKGEITDILTRTIGAEIRLVREGYTVRESNDGYINHRIWVDGKKKMIEIADPSRAHFFQTMFELRAQRLNDDEIVRRLNAKGFKTKTYNRWDKKKEKIIGQGGGIPLTVKQLQRYIQRTIYAGIRCERWTYFKPIRTQYEGLVSIERFNEANRGKIFIKENQDGTVQILYNHSPDKTVKRRLKYNPRFPYKFLLCDICHKPFFGSASTGKLGKKHPAYHCGCKNGIRKHKYYRIPQKKFEDSVKRFVEHLRFTDTFLESFEMVVNDVYRTREKEVVSEAAQMNQNVADLKVEQVSALTALTTTQSMLVRKKLEETIEDLQKRIEEAEGQRKEIEITEKDIKSFVRYVKYVMEHPAEVLMNTDDLRAQRTLFGLVFEETPTYLEVVNGTPKLSLAFKLSEEWDNQKSHLAAPRGVEPLFSG